MTTYLLDHALLPDGVADQVRVVIADGRFAQVTPGATDGERLPGLSLPGFANCHSHAFHRGLRGRTQAGRGTFWTWREQMYALAQQLDPDRYFALARATLREMVAAGVSCVGEFHYLHHRVDGSTYDDPNAMGEAVLAAAAEVGIRITLLDTCYVSAGFGKPVTPEQRRFSDGDAAAWAQRVDALTPGPGARVGAAIHSVRAVPRDQLAVVAEWASDKPLHVHLSEQRAENEQCVAAYGMSPTQLLAEAGALGPGTSVVHATHLTDRDIATLGEAGVYANLCPTTERDLGDGIGPSRRLHDAGARLTLGSDSHAIIDMCEEMRAVELNERLATERRGHWSAAELLQAATRTGHASLGWDDAGQIAVGQRADLVTLDMASPATAGVGADAYAAVFAATARDVTHTIVDGEVVFREAERAEIGRELHQAIEGAWTQA